MNTTSGATIADSTPGITGERADLLSMLAAARHFLRYTARNLDEEQARRRTTVSALTIGGLIKHVTACERNWAGFVIDGPKADRDFNNLSEADYAEWADGFRLLDGETLAGSLAEYEEVAKHTDELVLTLPDLDISHPLPSAPWNKPGERWTARRALLHVAEETAQHAGHADIIRESLDGQKTMG